MSDHWNLLADLLGTPNYAPRSKKGAKSEPAAGQGSAMNPEGTANHGAKPDTKPSGPAAQNPVAQNPVAGKHVASEQDSPKPSSVEDSLAAVEKSAKEPRERSMLQSSWDALASIFGVASDAPRQDAPRETIEPSEPEKITDSKDGSGRASKAKRTPTKSMWDSQQEQTDADEPTRREQPTPRPSSVESEPSNQRGGNRSRRSSEELHDETDRRGPRRAPRRGRSDADSVVEPPRQSNSLREPSESARPPEERRPHEERRRRDGRVEARSEARSEPRSEPRGEPRSEPRGDRRDDRNPRSPRRENETRPPKEPRRQERQDRETHNDRDRTSSSVSQAPPKKRGGSGFGSGLTSDIDPFESEPIGSDWQNSATDENDPFESFARADHQEDHETSETPQRTRTKKRRGRRRDDAQDIENMPSEDMDDSSEFNRSGESSDTRPKHGKVPSWTETIGVVVQANVANHQKQSSAGRGKHRRPSN